MNTTIPAPERFRQYANTIRQFLQDMQEKYPRYPSLPFETPEEQRKALDWLARTGPIYSADISKIEHRLTAEFEDVDNYFESDPAYKAACRFALVMAPAPDAFTAVTDRITRIAKRRRWPILQFQMIRKPIEAEIKWRQAISLTIANYLDGTSFRIATETKAAASRIADLLAKLESELESPEGLHLLNLLDWRIITRNTRSDMQGLQAFTSSDDLQNSFSFRKDNDLLGRITAKELLLANDWAFNAERKKIALILLGLSAFKTPIDMEAKTLDRVWARYKEERGAIGGANIESVELRRALLKTRDTNRPRKCPFSDPPIPNLIRTISGD